MHANISKREEEIAEYRKSNKILVKIKEGKKFYDVKIPNESFTYGIENRPSTPIKNVISNCYGQEDETIRDERKAVMKLME